MPTVPPPPPSSTARPAQPRLLSGTGGSRRPGQTATGATSFTATLPLQRPQPPKPTAARATPASAPASERLPGWAKGVVIGGVLLAIAMPLTVLMSRSMIVQEALAEQSSSKAAMVCTAGDARAVDGSSITGWLFGGSYFSCGEWETREARVQRERDQAQANFLARERARQGLPP